MKTNHLSLLVAFFLVGCSTMTDVADKPESQSLHARWEKMQNEPHFAVNDSIDLTAAMGVGAVGAMALNSTVDKMVVGALGLPTGMFTPEMALIYFLIYDPLSPNWKIQARQTSEHRFVFDMKAKNFRIGGDGEARKILKRRAEEVQRAKHATAYRIIEFVEGIDSSTPFAHRYAEATIELVGMPALESKK